MSRPELGEAFAAAGESAVQGVLLPPPYARKAVEELLPALPPQLGGGPLAPLVRSVQWAALGVDLPPKFSANLVIQSPDGAAAQALKKQLADLLEAMGKQKEVLDLFPDFHKLAALLTSEVEKDRLTLKLEGEKVLPIVLKTMVQKMRQAASRQQDQNNLKQIVLAMHNYNEVNKTFPPMASYDKNGKPLLSWRVHVLPYLDQQNLYNQFHLDEPWDSEHNKKLIARMPSTLRSPFSKAPAGRTTYLAPVGKAMMFTGEPKGVAINEVTDGTSNTIFLVDADDDHAVIWTKPEDLKIDANKPAAGLRHIEGIQGFLAAFVDGSVRVVSAALDAKTLYAYFTRNGGEVNP